jgi:hypothetical protein
MYNSGKNSNAYRYAMPLLHHGQLKVPQVTLSPSGNVAFWGIILSVSRVYQLETTAIVA